VCESPVDLHPYTIDVLSERLGLDGNHRLDIEAIRQRQVFQFSGDRFGTQFVFDTFERQVDIRSWASLEF